MPKTSRCMFWTETAVRQAADAMVARGCFKAYTLDGGQTCCTIVNGELISPVQFGYERETSDILYFATAVPEAMVSVERSAVLPAWTFHVVLPESVADVQLRTAVSPVTLMVPPEKET